MSEIEVKFFEAKWCGHCKSFKPQRELLQKELANNGIESQTYDADEDRNVINNEKINGFPTIKIYVNGVGEEYEGPRTKDAIFEAVMAKRQLKMPSLKGGASDNFYSQYRKYKSKYLKLKKTI
jgi:thiol-disulfide isomerase/thioredoxin